MHRVLRFFKTPKGLLTCADTRLLAAKRAGRGRVIGATAGAEVRA